VFRLLLALGLISLLSGACAIAQSNFAALRVADGFDFPLGTPNGDGYYKSRGFTVNGHLGEDWVSLEGPGKVFGAPVCTIGNGVVTLARDFRRAWGNVVVIRHVYLEDGQTRYIDSLYAHLDKILVAEGQPVNRGQQIGNAGNAHGLYAPHLHFEIHKNLSIGVVHTLFAGDLTNYYVPTAFIETHRKLRSSSQWLIAAIAYAMPSFPGIPAHPPFRNNMAARLAAAADAKKRGWGFIGSLGTKLP
jgi:murein DD-endopeptidase MepM/ murein hydrolase activator NlpD